jgi:hypothetical protein
MALIVAESWQAKANAGDPEYARVLEEGHILLFPASPIDVPADDRSFLLGQRMVSGVHHKNIAYRPGEDRVKNYVRQKAGDDERLLAAVRRYSQQAIDFVKALLPSYAPGLKIDYASFRPEEEAGRALPTRSRNDLLHVDAFPTRPVRGDRIMRVFTNINPSAARVWVTGETFEELAPRFAASSGLLERVRRGGARRAVTRVANAVGLPVPARSPYDEFMLGFHHFLKENADYQASARKLRSEFAPGVTWMVYTDMVSHSVLSGQYALEQTFIVSREVLALPEKAPIAILERIAGARMN